MRVWYGRLFLVLALGLGLMTGCGGQGGNYVDASLGTLYPSLSGEFNEPGLVLLVSGVLGEPTPSEGVEVQVKDPQGNTVYPVRGEVFPYRIKSSAGGFSSVLVLAGSAQSGTYTITATFPGGLELNRTVQVDATKRLDQPSSVQVSTSQNSATVQWGRVQDAESYWVLLVKEGSYGSVVIVNQKYTKDTSVTFSDLASGNYYVLVFAFNADLTSRPTPVPPQFNASYSVEGPFTIQ